MSASVCPCGTSHELLSKSTSTSGTVVQGICLFSPRIPHAVDALFFKNFMICHMNVLGSDEIFMFLTVWDFLKLNKILFAKLKGMANEHLFPVTNFFYFNSIQFTNNE